MKLITDVLRISCLLLLTTFVAFNFSSCLKGEFDSPPSLGSDPKDITADQIISLEEVMKLYVPKKYVNLTQDKYIQAVVVADDKTGSLYKSIIVEDENSDLGISVSIDETDIHFRYAVGRRVFIKLNGLTLSDNNNLPTLGLGSEPDGNFTVLGRIPASLMTKFIRPGVYGLKVEPRVKKLSELNTKDYNTLVKIENVEFDDPSGTYANFDNPDAPKFRDHSIKDCSNQARVLHVSEFSDYARLPVPAQNGSFTCVYTVYRTTIQMVLRDTSDLDLTKARCGGGTGGGDLITVASVRSAFTGTATAAPTGFVQGVVISDAANKNINGQNLVVQDASAGIILRFKAAIAIPLGTEVKVNVGGLPLSEFNGVLQVQDIPNTNAEVIGNKAITPKTITVSQADPNTLESTLVKIVDAELVGDTKYSTTLKIKDASGETILYTIAGTSPATFSGLPIKTGKVTVIAIVSEFKGTRQLTIRNLEDVLGTGGGCDTGNAALDCDNDGVLNGTDCAPNDANIFPGKACDDGNSTTTGDVYNATCVCAGSGGSGGGGIDESFSSQTNNMDISLPGWALVAVKGTRKWQGKLFSGNTYAQSTAFNDTNAEMETWMITPEVTTASTPNLTFESAKSFYVHDGLSVWATTNYTGDPATTTWVKLTATIAKQSDADNAFIPSGIVNLTSVGAKVRIAFKYEGNKATNTSTFRIDNVKVF